MHGRAICVRGERERESEGWREGLRGRREKKGEKKRVCEKREGMREREEKREGERVREGWRETEKERNRIVLELERARKHICFRLTCVNSYPSGNSKRKLSKEKKEDYLLNLYIG